MLPGGGLSVAVTSVILVLAAAKAHGRQVRIARERLGVTAVDFRGDNGPVVEAIWRRDRLQFWAGAITAAVLLVGGVLAGIVLQSWMAWAAVLIALVLAFACGFVVAGLLAWAGQVLPRPGDPDWMPRAHAASFGWWTLVAAALALVWLAVR